jgi:pimeloyl-ACP methyl ester carboxylesterase
MPEHLKQAPRAYAPEDLKPRPTVIVCDGDAGNMTFLILYAYHFCTNGFNVLTFDWRGFGGSESWPIEPDQLVYSEFLLDYDAAIEFVKGRRETTPERIGLFGFSTGAYLSFAVAVKRGDVAALACRGLLTSFDDVMPLLSKRSPDRTLRVPEDFPTELLPATAAQHMNTPTLLVVGEEDGRTPPWMSRYVHNRLSGPKELWVVSRAGHGGSTAPEYVGYPEFFRRVTAFFQEHLVNRRE